MNPIGKKFYPMLEKYNKSHSTTIENNKEIDGLSLGKLGASYSP
jgi:hypothetical protein